MTCEEMCLYTGHNAVCLCLCVCCGNEVRSVGGMRSKGGGLAERLQALDQPDRINRIN